MTMNSTSRVARGESVPQPRQSALTDQGGLLVGPIIRQATEARRRGKAWARRSASAPAPSGSARSGSVPSGSAPSGPGRPGSVLTSADLANVVAIAARAPSVHNTQPWKFRVTGDVIELRADPDRILPQIDPVGRELIVSCGA